MIIYLLVIVSFSGGGADVVDTVGVCVGHTSHGAAVGQGGLVSHELLAVGQASHGKGAGQDTQGVGAGQATDTGSLPTKFGKIPMYVGPALFNNWRCPGIDQKKERDIIRHLFWLN